jgi:hypothetical protein
MKRVNQACDFLEKLFKDGCAQASARDAEGAARWRDEEAARAQAEEEAKARESEERARAEADARTREEERLRAEADARRQAEKRRRAEERAKAKERRQAEVERFTKWLGLAQRGIAEAQYRVATMYQRGFGCTRNQGKCLRWMKKAAALGQLRALLYFGFASAWAIGARLDIKKAIGVYEICAEQGLADAQFQIGLMHYSGLGVKQDFEMATEWYFRAIKHGYKVAEARADTCGHLLTKTPKDYFRCYRCYSVAVRHAT